MKQSLRSLTLASTFIASIIALTACSKVHVAGESEVNGAVTSSDAIVGGVPVAAEEDVAKTTVQIFNFIVQHDMFGRVVGIRGIAGCTGTLLANDILLTAAHCTNENPNYMLLYFSKDVPKDFDEIIPSNPLVRRVVGGKVGDAWPKITAKQVDNHGDIALLKFSGGIPEGYQVASLLPARQVLKVQQPITLAGFGITDGITHAKTDKLLKVDVTILNPKFSRTEMLIDSGLKGPCHGDSGGPAFVKGTDGKQYVAGVTSRADQATDPKGLCIGDTVYTKVQPHAAWIKRSIASLQSPDFKPELIPQPGQEEEQETAN
jgi:hypothetical protein